MSGDAAVMKCFHNPAKSVVLRLVLCNLLLLSAYQLGNAQQQDELNHSQFDMVALKQEVNALRDQQRQILDQLNELKQMLQANPAGRTAPPLASTVQIKGERFRGENSARVAIVEYADFECPYCGRYVRDTYPQILENYVQTGKVKYFFRDLPLPMHARAIPAARAARCAGEQDKYWEMHDSLFANQAALAEKDFLSRAQALGLDEAKFQECLSSQRYLDDIRNSMSEAQKMGIGGTPTFLIGTIGPDGNLGPSGLPFEARQRFKIRRFPVDNDG